MEFLGPIRRIFEDPFKAFDEVVPVPGDLGDVQLLKLECFTRNHCEYATMDSGKIIRWYKQYPNSSDDYYQWFMGSPRTHAVCNYTQVDNPGAWTNDTSGPYCDQACVSMPFDAKTYGTGISGTLVKQAFPSYNDVNTTEYSKVRTWIDSAVFPGTRMWLLCQAVKVTYSILNTVSGAAIYSHSLPFWHFYTRTPMLADLLSYYTLNSTYHAEVHSNASLSHCRHPGDFYQLDKGHPVYIFRRPMFTEDHDGYYSKFRPNAPYHGTYNPYPNTNTKMNFYFERFGTAAFVPWVMFDMNIVSWVLVSSRPYKYPVATCCPISRLSWLDLYKLSNECTKVWNSDGL